MKNNRNVLKAIAAAVFATTAGLASAGTVTQQLNVSAQVQGVCKFTTGAAIAMTFVAIDPSSTGDKTRTVQLPFQCTKNMSTATAAVTAGGLTLTGTGGTPPTMGYSIDSAASLTVPTGAGFAAAATNISVTGRIADTAYQAAPADTYTDTVTVTLTF